MLVKAKPAARVSWLPNDLHQQGNAFGQKRQENAERCRKGRNMQKK